MAINPEQLLALDIPDVRQAFDWRDCVIYALGLGQGIDPLDEAQLKYIDETKLVTLPTMANVLAYPGFWMRDLDTGIDWVKVVHGEQAMRLHRPLPTSGEVIGTTRIVDLVDKGEGRGALIYVERNIADAQSGAPLATLLQTVFCRGDGGFGGQLHTSRTSRKPPERAPDLSIDQLTHPQMALIYRLSGDLNPLHSDPATAQRAGYDRPILHGLATFGLAGAAMTKLFCGDDPERFAAIEGRFSAPVYPGETVTFDAWDLGNGAAAFQARVSSRAQTVLSNGYFEFRSKGDTA